MLVFTKKKILVLTNSDLKEDRPLEPKLGDPIVNICVAHAATCQALGYEGLHLSTLYYGTQGGVHHYLKDLTCSFSKVSPPISHLSSDRAAKPN